MRWDAEDRITDFGIFDTTPTSSLTQVMGEITPDGDLTDDTYYLLGMDVIGAETNNAWSYHHSDGIGSLRMVTDNLGANTYTASYDPYGNIIQTSGTSGTSFGYTGEQTDSTGLQYLRARYYNPSLGIFIAKDPVWGVTGIAMSMNGYSYVHGNPINMIDPTGMQAETIRVTVISCYGVAIAVPADAVIGGEVACTLYAAALLVSAAVASNPVALEDTLIHFAESCSAAFEMIGGPSISIATDPALFPSTLPGGYPLEINDETIWIFPGETIPLDEFVIPHPDGYPEISLEGVFPNIPPDLVIPNIYNTVISDVIDETNASTGNITSKHTLTQDEALEIADKWVGDSPVQIAPGVYRNPTLNADGTVNQYRIDNSSLDGAHDPNVPHIHLQKIAPGVNRGRDLVTVNNHIPITP